MSHCRNSVIIVLQLFFFIFLSVLSTFIELSDVSFINVIRRTILLPPKFVLFVTSEQRRLLVFVVWESDHQFKILQCLDCTICFNFQKKKIDKYNHSQRILPEVKVDVHRWRGMEQLMMGLPRAPKSRPARPAVGLQPPKLKVKIKEIIQCRAEYEILIFYLSNWTDPGPVFKWQLINHNCVRLTSNSNCHLCWL